MSDKSRLVPNSFQTPNAHVDELMQFLTGDEYKVLNFAVRHIMGWQDTIVERQNAISLTTFEKGFTAKSGREFGGCGLARPTIVKVLAELENMGLLAKVGKPTSKGQVWRLGEVIDWDRLAVRLDERKSLGRSRMATARAISGQSDLPVNGTDQAAVNGTHQQRLVALTGGGQSDLRNQTHPETHLETQDETQAAGGQNIFELYEYSFGKLPDSALLVDELKDMDAEFPAGWIAEAFRETALSGARSPAKYARKIMMRWQADGRPVALADGQPDGSRYVSGKLGAFVNNDFD